MKFAHMADCHLGGWREPKLRQVNENNFCYAIDKSIEECKANSGKIIAGPKNMGNYGRYCVIEDPAGAVCALFEPA